jgi:cytidyltransferase-like protein
MYKYKKIGLGGTFDHFHKGHQAFLLFASQLAQHLVIGITTPEMITHKKFSSQIQEYEMRADAVKSFTKNFFNTVDVIPLTDPYGPTLLGSNVEALAATTATQSGAEAVNKKRESLGLSQLPIHTCELENDDIGQPLASERIRAGSVNRQGKVYKNIFVSTITLTDKQKQFFSKQHGPLVHVPSPSENIFVVGDSSLESFRKHDWPYQLGVIDHLKNRKAYQPDLQIEEPILTTQNQPGEISPVMAAALENALQNKTKHVVIEGEEDLAAAALALLAPLGTLIYYGLPGKGMIEMEVTEALKDDCLKVLSTP